MLAIKRNFYTLCENSNKYNIYNICIYKYKIYLMDCLGEGIIVESREEIIILLRR